VAATTPVVAEDPGLRPWQFFLLAGMLAATAGVIAVSLVVTYMQVRNYQ